MRKSFIVVEPGTFMMGSAEDEGGRGDSTRASTRPSESRSCSNDTSYPTAALIPSALTTPWE
jgi:hypothetical protein